MLSGEVLSNSLDDPEGIFNNTNAQLWSQASFFVLPNATFSVDLGSNVGTELEDLITNITISILGFPDPLHDSTSLVNPVLQTPTPAFVTNTVPIYRYSPDRLFIVYGTTIGLCTFCVLLGLLTVLRTNHIHRDLSFSQIIVSSRNPSLDELCRTTEGKAKQVLRETNLGFGQLSKGAGTAFGLKDDFDSPLNQGKS